MTRALTIETHEQIEVVDVTDALLEGLGSTSGLIVFRIEHTTAALLVGADDPDLRDDLTSVVGGLLAPYRPFNHALHDKPNGEAHILSALAGTQVCLPLASGRIPLGRWQRLLLLELDGPQRRTIHTHLFALEEE